MANLTEDQQRAFGDRMLQILEDDDTKAACTAADSGFDPTKRVAKLTPLQDVCGDLAAAWPRRRRSARGNAIRNIYPGEAPNR